MSIVRSLKSFIILATVMAIGAFGAATKPALARGGHGGGGHGGGHAGGHGAARHPYHPSAHHQASHRNEHRGDQHHDNHHWHHHHHDWHHAGWGWNPGFWGGLGLGYGVGAWAGWPGGGDTYVDNSNSGNTVDNSTQPAANAQAAGADKDNENDQQADQLAVDVWPELGISTYSGEYGQSKGLVVVRVMPHSAGDLAGLVPGDVILKFNGQLTPDDEALESVLDKIKGEFSLFVWDARTGRKSTLAGKLDAAAGEEAGKIAPSSAK